MLYDAVIAGGSFAGLSAAIQLARARRHVLVIDAGQPRNRFAGHSHGVLGHDGRPGTEILDDARAQLLRYPTVFMEAGEARMVTKSENGFEVRTKDSRTFEGKRLLLATGVTDMLPDVRGLQARWGKGVLHCPYCHGYEIGGGSIGVLATGPMSAHQALMAADWGDVTFFLNGFTLDDQVRAMLGRRRVVMETCPVEEVEGAAPEIDGVRLRDGRLVPVRALFLSARTRPASAIAEYLGCVMDDTPLGPIIRTDTWKQTTVPGVFAAGDAARVPHNITLASADGVTAAHGLHRSLVMEEANGV